jgi:MFS family permease
MAVALAVAGSAIGVGMTAAYSVAGGLLPPDAHVTGFGVLTTASLIGLAVSPVIAGFLGASGLGVVFVFDVVLLVALAAAVWATMQRGRSGVTGSRKYERGENTKENWSTHEP